MDWPVLTEKEIIISHLKGSASKIHLLVVLRITRAIFGLEHLRRVLSSSTIKDLKHGKCMLILFLP